MYVEYYPPEDEPQHHTLRETLNHVTQYLQATYLVLQIKLVGCTFVHYEKGES